MNKNFIFLMIILIIISSAFVFAAGSGGGGRVINRAETEPPEIVQIEQKPVNELDRLKCGDLDSRVERVRCRIKLEDEDYAKENELQYLPEECRDLSKDKKSRCINIYKKTQRCWQFPVGESRLQCVRESLNLGRVLSSEIKICDSKGTERVQCISDVREKVFDLIKFRFYDLEERAEKLLKDGKIDEETVVQFVADLEIKKVEFNNAATIKEKKETILEVRQIWKEFVKKIK